MKKYSGKAFAILANYVFPIIILTFLSHEEYLGTTMALLFAMAAPLCYGAYTLFHQRRPTHAVIGSLVVLSSGIILLLGGGKTAILIKETIVPLTFSFGCLILIVFHHSLIDIIWNNTFNAKQLESWFAEKGEVRAYAKCRYAGRLLLPLSGIASAFIKLTIGAVLISGNVGSEELVQSVGQFKAISMPTVIVSNLLILPGGYILLAIHMAKTLNRNFTDIFKVHAST